MEMGRRGSESGNTSWYNGEDFYETLSKQEVELILEIYGVYGQFAAWRLRLLDTKRVLL
jgi:hypothetical protein